MGNEINGFCYIPPKTEAVASQATLGCKFSNDTFLLESFLKQMNIGYYPDDLEETPFGPAFRIKKNEEDHAGRGN